MKTRFILAFLSIAVILVFAPKGIAAEEFKSTIDEVELVGRLATETYKNHRGVTEKAVMLNLESPVNVDRDELHVRTRNVTKIQLAFFNGRIKARTSKNIKKKVRVKGILFYAHRPNHYTPILMDVKDVARLGR